MNSIKIPKVNRLMKKVAMQKIRRNLNLINYIIKQL